MKHETSMFKNKLTNQSENPRISDGDLALFKKLDQCSSEFRIAAEDMANFLHSLKNTSEFQQLESSFRQVKTVPISKMDLCLKTIEKEFLKIKLKELDGKNLLSKIFKDQNKATDFINKQIKFNELGASLMNKAIELSQGIK
jgi:hypothetical protein